MMVRWFSTKSASYLYNPERYWLSVTVAGGVRVERLIMHTVRFFEEQKPPGDS